MLDRLNRISAEYNMKINTKKTKVMKIGKEKGGETTTMIVIEGERIEEVKEFCYLGSMISNNAKCHRKIKRMIKTLIWSITLYCAETWTMRQVDIARLEAFEMWIWRRMERISWTEHISNEEVLTLVGEERSLISTIRARQRNWMGHLLRGDSLQREIMEGRMEGKRGRGRPRQKLL